MAVRPHPSKTTPGIWQIDYWPTGRKGKRIYETFEGTREAAEQRHTELCLQHSSAHRSLISPRLEEVITEYLTWLQLHRSPAYYKSMVWALDKLKPVFGRHPIKNITPVLFDEFKTLHKDTPAHCNQCIDYLKAIIGWMVKRGYAQPLPFAVEKLRHFRSIPQPPDPSEFLKFFQQVQHNLSKEGITPQERDKKELLVLLIYETGLRWVEARHLRWEHLRNDGRLYLGRTKTGEARYTVLPDYMVQRLWVYHQPTGYIFINPKTGNPYTTIRKLIQGAREKAGVNVKGTHGLRHAMGTDTQESSGDIRATQDILGHSDIKTSAKYAHVAIGRKRRILEETRVWRSEQIKSAKKVDTNPSAE